MAAGATLTDRSSLWRFEAGAWLFLRLVLGVAWVVRAPQVLGALDPTHAARFIADHGWTGFTVLGAVFLVVTGSVVLGGGVPTDVSVAVPGDAGPSSSSTFSCAPSASVTIFST